MAIISVLDYGAGNLQSIQVAFSRIGVETNIIKHKDDIATADAIVLPGVGNFNSASNFIKETRTDIALTEFALIEKKPILGICLGMQLMASVGMEGAQSDGLNWIPGKVRKMKRDEVGVVPKIGWDKVKVIPAFQNNFRDVSGHYFFAHSYIYECNSNFVAARTVSHPHHCSIVIKDNIWGVQFHPEKSQEQGLVFLKRFMEMVD